jgi:hypothetical protein
MKRFGAILLMVLGGSLMALAATPATCDTKSEMVVILDKLGDNQPGDEALVDWDNLVVKTPQTKNMDVQKMYRGMDATNKKGFRTSFLSSFSNSFKQSSGGHKFVEVAKKKGALTVVESSTHPVLVVHQQGGKPDLRILFTRKSKKLLFQGLESK